MLRDSNGRTPGADASTCNLCGKMLTMAFHFTCHVCGANYCYAHMPQKCDHRRTRNSFIPPMRGIVN